jgi:RNA polymerase sigma factor (sigma-70 family)
MYTASYTDAEIISGIKSGRKLDQVIGYIYREYYGLLERLVLQNSGNQADAEDVIQEVLIVFVEMVQKDKYQARASVKSFLYTLTRNLWISEIRRRKSASRRNEAYENGRDTSQKDVSEYLAYKENQHFILSLFAALGDKCQRILTLFYFEEYTMKEILQETDFENEQVLRNKKYKCLKTLIGKVQQSSEIYKQLKKALHHAKW